jgi:MraZ protein
MVTRKTQYGWMAAGGLICLFALVLACKLRDGARAAAQAGPALADPKPAETKPKHPKKEETGSILLPEPGDPLPPIVVPPADLATLPPPPPAPGKVQATMPLPPAASPPSGPPPVQISAPREGPPLLSGPVVPAGYTPDPVAGAAGTDTVVPPPEKAPPVKLGPPPAAARMPEPLPAPAGPLDYPGSPDGLPVPKPAAAPTWSNPATTPPQAVEPAETHPLPGEPPLAPSPGPVQTYQVRSPETMRDLARRTLGAAERWTDIHKLNPLLKPETTLAAGTTIRLPGDACVTGDETEPVKPLPAMHPKAGPAKPKVVLPLTGTYPANLDDKKTMTLPAAIREQLAGADTVLVSPGPDQCLWLTNQEHLERLAQRLEQSPAREIDVRVFKRLYYAQTEKTALNSEGRVTISDRLAQFAGLHQEVILVGIDDHFELWDAGRWRQYTQQKSGGRSSVAEQE